MTDCRGLSIMGATLANGGANPCTGERVIAPTCTERVLSVMSTCGMYDGAGEWFAQVGMAAKSGVGGRHSHRAAWAAFDRRVLSSAR